MRPSVVLAQIAALAVLAACGSDRDRSVGQTSFESAPPNSTNNSSGAGSGASDGAGAADAGAGPASGAPGTSTTRTVEETDLYRLDGTRLYYLNSYRGLMVFDVSDPDHPALLGRSAIFGQPIDMIVRNGVAIVVVGDWFGRLDDGTPFHGSIVRGLDATDPTNIRVLGEAKLGGWVRDDRVVGDVIYAVSEDFNWFYGYDDAVDGYGGYGGPAQESVGVTSVSFANNTIQQVDHVQFDGFNGVFNVTPNAIMFASVPNISAISLLYLDISDPAGHIAQRGSVTVPGGLNGWSADNGRWNLDFADGKTARVLGQAYDSTGGFVLSTVDFSKPDAPVIESSTTLASPGWSATARFDTNRLYLSPQTGYYDGSNTTPFLVYDLTDPTAPKLAGTVSVPGTVWNILPAPDQRIFALGNDYANPTGATVSLQYLDISNVSAPKLLGTSTFGQGWAWTPAAGTFKAFTMDTTRNLVVLPFAGWDSNRQVYNNGLQLIEFSPTSVTTAGAAHTKGWVERGIFVGNRLVSLSDQALAVVDYQDPAAPRVVTELTLARNVVTAQPSVGTIAEVSSDWWDNDTTTSQVRVLPIGSADETADTGVGAAVPTVNVDGVGAQVFTNNQYTYVVTSVPSKACSGASYCGLRIQQVQVVDTANGTAVLRGKIQLPDDGWNDYGWGWYGFWWYDWWGGADVVQVGSDALVIRRFEPVYDSTGQMTTTGSKLFVVDLSNPDAPQLGATPIDDSTNAWWGNLRVVGNALYVTHYDWIDDPSTPYGWVKYYLDVVDLGNRAKPRIGRRINIPGLLVGGDPADPTLVYTIDYRWDSDRPVNDFDVLRLHDSTATLLSQTPIRGWVGSTFFTGTQAYVSAEQEIEDASGNWHPRVDLHAIDVSNPAHPRDRIASDHGWGWLLAVLGDRALVTSGWWGEQAIDVYRLRDNAAPQFEQTIRTRGWALNGASRQGQTLFLSSGYWGVQTVQLQ